MVSSCASRGLRICASTVITDHCVCDSSRFESVDSAEQCIEALRRFRNLHPSFSKVHFRTVSVVLPPLTFLPQQVHKIPGTAYANVPVASAPPDAVSSDSFKFRMERLKDTSSTNLYIEGLPLSIDEPVRGFLPWF
jgi:hypothetical protein